MFKSGSVNQNAIGGYLLALFLAVVAGLIVVVAPALLVIPVIAIGVALLLYVAVRTSSRTLPVTTESWPAYALTALWAVVINLPTFIAFDPTGLTREQGLFNPQSIGRILVFIAVSLATLVFWSKWSRSPMRNAAVGLPVGTTLALFFYIWYLLTAPLVISGTPLILSIFRTLEWLVAVYLLVLIFVVQNSRGTTAFSDRLKLILPMLFFLLLSNLLAYLFVPSMIYSVSAVTNTARFGGLFTHPNLLAFVCVLLFAYALAFLKTWQRVGLATISLLVLVLTYSRGGFAAFGVTIVIGLTYLVKGVPAKLALLGVSLATAVMLSQIPTIGEKVTNYLERGSKTQSLESLSERTAIWDASKILIKRAPWLGSGFIAGPKLIGDVMIEKRLSKGIAAVHAHNEFLQAQISGGPVALLLSVFIQLRVAYLLIIVKNLRPKERFFGWAVFTGCFMWGFLQPSLSYFLYLPGVLFIWLLFTLEGLRVPNTPADKLLGRQRTTATKCRAGLYNLHVGFIVLLVVGSPLLASPAMAATAFHESSFVTVKDGHLKRDNQRLRVWGVNVQSGVFKTYPEIDSLLNRLGGLGFNAIRIWPTSGTFYKVTLNGVPRFNASTPGDGSDLDRFDYLVAGASQRGINIQMTMLHYLDLPTLKSSPETAIAEIARAATDDVMLRRLHGFAPYVSTGYRERLKRHMQWVLARKNPYTGRRYADEPAVSTWELANEANFVQCAIKPTCLAQLPPIAISYLNTEWVASPHNAQAAPLPTDFAALLVPAFYTNYSAFVADQFIAVSQELRAFARSVGGVGSGIASQPFIFNTDPDERSALSHYAYSSGDVYSAAAYASPLSATGASAPWKPYVTGDKSIPLLEYIKVKDKPFIVYEGSFFRPYPYRAEWGVVMAALALKQDWDGAFLYIYGQPSVIYDWDGKTVQYGNKPLPTPVPGEKGVRGQYAYGFHHGGDPIAMATWSIGGRLFLGAPKTNVEPEVQWDIPLDGVYKPGKGYPAAFLTPSNLIETPRTKSMTVRFTNDTAICHPCVNVSVPTSEVVTDWGTAGRLTVKSPTGQAIVGELSGNLGVLGDGIAAQVVKPGFGIVAVFPGEGLNASTVQVLGDAENTGYKFEPTLVNFSGPAGAMSGVLVRGTAPLLYTGPTIRFLFSSNVQSYSEIDINLVKSNVQLTDRQYVFSPSNRVFQVDFFTRKE